MYINHVKQGGLAPGMWKREHGAETCNNASRLLDSHKPVVFLGLKNPNSPSKE